MSAIPRTGAERPDPGPRGWAAELTLGFVQRGGRTVLGHRRHSGPLMVQSPFYPGDGACHVYVLHPPGGVVPGDSLRLTVEAETATHALLTTPAATKLYRSDGRPATVEQRLRARAGARLEWLPHETIVFDGAQTGLATRIDLDRGARFIGWEYWCLGLPARGERFTRGRFDQTLEIRAAGQTLLVDRQPLRGGDPVLDARWGLGGFPAGGTLLAYPAGEPLAERVRGLCADLTPGLAGVTRLGDLLVCRGLAPSPAALAGLWRRVWAALRPEVIGAGALAPRIWAT